MTILITLQGSNGVTINTSDSNYANLLVQCGYKKLGYTIKK